MYSADGALKYMMVFLLYMNTVSVYSRTFIMHTSKLSVL